jgi:RNA-binding protein YlmH
MEAFLIEHLQDLSARSDAQNIFTFSDFLSPEEQSRLLSMRRQLSPFTLFGGTEGTERNMARFGSESKFGYEQPFPIVCLKIEPVNRRFAQLLSHRDYLGAIMSLGIERSGLGDLVIREYDCYLFCTERIAPYLQENLIKIGHTDVRATVCDALPEGALYETEPMRLTVTSLRLDCVAGAVVKLSRSKISDLIREKKVFLNGAVCEKPDALLNEGDVFSVRGAGKFRFCETLGNSKKGKFVIHVDRYK